VRVCHYCHTFIIEFSMYGHCVALLFKTVLVLSARTNNAAIVSATNMFNYSVFYILPNWKKYGIRISLWFFILNSSLYSNIGYLIVCPLFVKCCIIKSVLFANIFERLRSNVEGVVHCLILSLISTKKTLVLVTGMLNFDLFSPYIHPW